MISSLLLLALAQVVTPPQVIENPPATYPLGHREAAQVVVLATVSPQGAVDAAEVAQGGGADFDAAALAAVRRWKFKPATRDGEPFAARIKIPFVFEPPPELDAGPPPAVTAVPEAPVAEPDAGLPPDVEEVSVRGQMRAVQHGGSDFQIEVGQLAQNVQTTRGAAAILELAPGIFIANEGGQGHADQVFLRGFNAEQGQEIEFTVNGVPINDVDNPDGHGYADTHFIIPELVKNLRVVEGPFDPHQGDFAVAGSANYELGVDTRGLRLSLWEGTYGTQRLLGLWAPKDERAGTFAAVQLFKSDGYGANRASLNASAMAQYEGELGQRGLWRVLVTSYATHYKDAGVIREDDYKAGRVDFYGSEDNSLGGDAQRHGISFDLQNPFGHGTLTQQLFLTYKNDRIAEDFTGFELDQQVRGQSPHAQRGDGIEQDYSAITAGARGAYRYTGQLLGRDQSLELGYFARYDHTTPLVQRVRFGTQIPYRVDEDHVTDVVDLAGYADVDLHPTSWLTLRGGVREEFFDYDDLENCATSGFVPFTNPTLDLQCPDQDRAGFRLNTQRATATGQIAEPKISATAQLVPALAATASYGVGAQSLGPEGLTQEENAPFATIRAAEGGVLAHQRFTALDLSGRAVAFYTHVDHDLVFDPSLGRLSAANGTTRRGLVGSLRATGRHVDELLSATYAYATFDDDHTLVPYVPALVARSDTAVFGELPRLRLDDRPFQARAGLGAELVGRRALPLGQSTDPTFVMDLSASARWRAVELGLKVENLLDAKYPLSTFFYASDFHTRAYATLAPTEHFTAAPPRMSLLTLTVYLDDEGSP